MPRFTTTLFLAVHTDCLKVMPKLTMNEKQAGDQKSNAEMPTSETSTSEMPTSEIAAEPYSPILHVVLYQPEIPYNTGSVGRTCVAVGAKLWLVRPLGFRVDDYHLRRAGLDYWQHLNWQVVDDWQQLTDHLPIERHWYFTKFADHPVGEAKFRPADVLVFGRESQGLPADMLEQSPAHRRLRLATRPQVRSLNLSNSVAVACYEAMGQWRREGVEVDLPD